MRAVACRDIIRERKKKSHQRGQNRGSILRFGGQIKRQYRGPRTCRELFYLQ